MQDIENRLLALLRQELGTGAGTIDINSPIDALGDSLDWIELQLAIEDNFGVEIPPARSRTFDTLRDVAGFLREATLPEQIA